MSSNQQAQIRYQVLDRCFSDFKRKYFIEDLITACSEAMVRQYGNTVGCSKRQIQMDITFLKREDGYNAPIESYKDGKKTYYRYSINEFSINNQELSTTQKKQILDALHLLSGIEGLPGLEWASTALVKLGEGFDMNRQAKKVVSFEENMYLEGLSYFDTLYQAILSYKVLEITYHPFQYDTAQAELISPHYLKQYNNRWFLFGYNHKANKIQNLALDRIKDIKDNRKESYQYADFNYEEYFEDIIGVSQYENKEVEEVVLQVRNAKLLPYIQTKPLHGSQKVDKVANVIRLQVKLNYELEALILSLGDQVEVKSPPALVEKIKSRIKNMQSNYECSDSA
ncbi:helix-turn-helix transcriptional regulator [Myroides odoratimimus]|uniref:helix-turn-helix transcriptional regulator n=1 Tax=Myroides odoratimimus TaxID=76832 RepID=UPI002575AD7D|nr:WYL domain-containing protein [Myroides odoratimimus]MDM1093174.1 WYL domain-containing protein [Myroides odoratimimus]MDM1527569.1 WYL domain-containing protein [Myroides odoratimimus]